MRWRFKRNKLWRDVAKIYLFGAFGLGIILLSAHFIQVRAEGEITRGLNDLHARALDSDDACFGARAVLNKSKCRNALGKIDLKYTQFAERDIYYSPISGKGLCWADPGLGVDCALGDLRSPRTYLLIGDSHAEHLINAMNIMGAKLHIKIQLFVFAGGCDKLQPNTDRCAAKRRQVFNELVSEADGVLMSYADTIISVDERTKMRYGWAREQIRMVKDSGKPLFWIQDVPPSGPEGGPNCLDKGLSCKVSREFGHRDYQLNRLLDDKVIDEKNVIRLDKLFCDEKFCFSYIGGVPVYFNDDEAGNSHITATFSATMGEFFVREFKNKINNGS